MQKNIYKKILNLTLLTIFLFSIFLPFNQSLAQTTNPLFLSANKYTTENNEYTTITAKINDYTIRTTQNIATINFFSSPGVEGFNNTAKCLANIDNSWSCFVKFRSSASGSYNITASTINGVNSGNILKVKVCEPGQTTNNNFCEGDSSNPTLTTTSLNPTSVILKAEKLTPNFAMTFIVDNGDSIAPNYYKEQEVNSDNNGNASSSFSGLDPGGKYVGIVEMAHWLQAKVTFTTPTSTQNPVSQLEISVNKPVSETGKINLQKGEIIKVTVKLNNPNGEAPSKIVTFSSIGNETGLKPKTCTFPASASSIMTCSVNFSSLIEGTFTLKAEVTTDKLYRVESNPILIKNCIDPNQILINDICTTPEILPGGNNANTTGETEEINTDTTYTPLAPLPGLGTDGCKDKDGNPIEDPKTGEIIPCIDTQKSDTNPCPFGNYLNIMIKLIIGFAAVLAMIMIVMGGIEYMTSELVSGKESGKETVTNAILGLLIALGAYMILNTINPALLDACLDKLPEAKIIIDDSVPQTPINGMYCTKTAGTNGGYKAGADWKTIAGEAKALPSGVNTNNGECMKVGDSNCTSLRGLDLSIINNIKNKCGSGCEIIVTAGTECWLHGGKSQNTTHRPNSPTIDVRATLSANTFFTGNTSFPNDNKPYNKGGISCVAEPANATSSTTGSHWHCQ